MIKKILVPTDGSGHARKAIEFACDIALKYEARLYLVHVVSPPPALFHEGAFAVPDLQKALEEDGKKIIMEAEGQAKKCGAKDVRSDLIRGNPTNGIIEFAKTEGVDMIVMGNRGLTAIKEFVLGSVSHRVGHLADCTVTIVK
jgi:nucleotide-binding universal stress UspA family protein